MGRVSLDLLQQFVQVARLGNLSRAAEQANLTVSALSHQVRQLEQRLERRLFERMFDSDDQKEGMRAFLEKRKPVYRGR